MLVGSCLQCRGASAIWLVNHWRHLTSSTLISVWPCCTPGPWSTSTLCFASDGGYLRRQKGQLEKTATSGSTRFRRMPMLYCYLRSGDLRSPGIAERRNGHSDYATTMTIQRLVSKMEGKTNFSRNLQAVRNRDC